MGKTIRLGFLVILLALGVGDTAGAGWFGRGSQFACDRPAYPRAHCTTPTLVRWWQSLRGYAVGCDDMLYPDIPGEIRIMPYPCRYADPATIPYGFGPPPAAVIPVHPYGSIPPGSE